MRVQRIGVLAILVLAATCVLMTISQPSANAGHDLLDQELTARLQQLGFTGKIESTLEQRLGRHLDNKRADLGRMLWFDTIGGLNNDNTCGGCHSPTNAFGDTQSIAIGIDNNGIVGPHRTGPRNQRRTPMAINTAFFPTLMWNSRFASLSGDPFDNNLGFKFPPPEGLTLSYLPQLLDAQAFIPPTERVEVAGFTFPGNNFAIRAEVLNRLNAVDAYRKLFGEVFPEVKNGASINFDMFGQATAEFEFSLVFANAPIDQYARGQKNALTNDQKKGGLLFFGRAGCVTSPLRSVALQPTFFHNGAFTRLEDAIRYHLNVVASVNSYDPVAAGVAADLTGPMGPMAPVLARIDPLLANPVYLSDEEFRQLLSFVRNGLLDPRARPENLRKLVPKSVPSARPVLVFEFQ